MAEGSRRIMLPCVATSFVHSFLRRSRRRDGRCDNSQMLFLEPDGQTIRDHHDVRRYVLHTKKDSGFRAVEYTDVYRPEMPASASALTESPAESESDIPLLSRSSHSTASSASPPSTPPITSADADAAAAATAATAEPAQTQQMITERLRHGYLTATTYEAVFRVSRSSVGFCGPHILANARTAVPPVQPQKAATKCVEYDANAGASAGADATADVAVKQKPTFPYFATENWRYSSKAAATQKVSLAMGCSNKKKAMRMWRFYPCFGDGRLKRFFSKVVGPSNFECIEDIDKRGWYWYQVYSHNNSNRVPIAYESLSEMGQSRLVISEFLDAEMTDCIVSLWLLRLNNVGFMEAMREAYAAERRDDEVSMA